jgi:hypothetical protein
VVDVSSLRAATGDLQPRDRAGRAASDEQIQTIRANLDPALLMPGPFADRGAPVVGPDGIVESGNGRVAAIRLVYESRSDRAAAYRQAIEEAGFEIPEGMAAPVLIARRTGDMDDAARRAWVRENNTAATGRMSAAEQAATDADYLTPDVMALWRPGSALGSAANAPFRRAVLARMPQAERMALYSAEGALSPDGFERLTSAMVARAFDAQDLLRLRAESGHPAVTGLIRMLEDIAPDWAYFRALVDAGIVPERFDITPALMDTIRIVARARIEDRDGQSVIAAIRDRLAQGDMFAAPDPMTEALIAAFYRGDRARSPDATGDILRRYAAEAATLARADQADLTGPVTPRDILEGAVAAHDRKAPAPAMPALPEPRAVAEVPATADAPMFDDGAAARAAQDAATAAEPPPPRPADPAPEAAAPRAEAAPDTEPDLFAGLPPDREIPLTSAPNGPTVTVAELRESVAEDRQLIETLTACRIGGAA